MSTLALLMQSRKFWVGSLAIVAIAATTVLVSLKIIPMTAYLATSGMITSIGLGVIGSIAWEDSAQKGASNSATNVTTTTISKGDQS